MQNPDHLAPCLEVPPTPSDAAADSAADPQHQPNDQPQELTTRSRGFTLIEIMAVVVIMGMLMGVLAVGITSQLNKARMQTAKGQIARIEQALEFYQLDNARYPNADQGLEALVTKPSAAPIPRDYNPAGYIKPDALDDPWGQAFEYKIPGTQNPHSFDIWSIGPDGAPGGDDIGNWSTRDNDNA
ncbi:MAG: type II secretion system major pseudopilin GspG [Myxococcota bacterium]